MIQKSIIQKTIQKSMIQKSMIQKSLCLRANSLLISGAFLVIASASSTIATAADQTDRYAGPKITFEQIYANPDDQQLNLSYARQQADKGDLISAASALERLLFAQPNWDSARLFYALVLFKLDDRKAAMSELNLLEGRPLTVGQRKQVDAYKGNFNGTSKSVEASPLSGKLAVGLRADDNAGNALSDSVIAVANQGDMSFFAQGMLNLSVPVTKSGHINFHAGVNGQTRRHDTFSLADYDAIGGNLGLSAETGDWVWRLGLDAVQVSVSGDKYLTQVGPSLKLTKFLSEDTSLTLSATGYYQDYDNLSFTVNGQLRSGQKYTLMAAIQSRLNENQTIGGSIAYEDKNAAIASLAYNGFRARANFFNGFENGIYIKGDASYRILTYDGINLFPLSSVVRKDDHLAGRFSLGASLSTIGRGMGMTPNAGMDRIFLEGGVNYINRDSNITTFKYENIGAELKLIWEF